MIANLFFQPRLCDSIINLPPCICCQALFNHWFLLCKYLENETWKGLNCGCFCLPTLPLSPWTFELHSHACMNRSKLPTDKRKDTMLQFVTFYGHLEYFDLALEFIHSHRNGVSINLKWKLMKFSGIFTCHLTKSANF